MSDNRDHFVYRVFDEFGELLYVGCTKRPERRLVDHRTDGQPWLAYMKKVRLEGPYEKRTGFEREAEVIVDEVPHFNATSEHKRIAHARWRREQSLYKELRAARPDFHDIEYGSPEWDEFDREMDAIRARVDAEMPARDRDWRHLQYLAVRDGLEQGRAA